MGATVRSVNEILTLRNWLIGAWIVAYEQEGADRARYGERLIDALAAAFKVRGVGGLGRSNLKNYRQIALTWPALGIRQTLSGESGAPGHRKSGPPGLRLAVSDPSAHRRAVARLACRRTGATGARVIVEGRRAMTADRLTEAAVETVIETHGKPRKCVDCLFGPADSLSTR